MHVRVWVFISLICFANISQAQLPDPLTHVDGLSLVMLERIRFNDFLVTLPPTFAREFRLSAEQVLKVKELALARRSSYQDVLAKLNPDWKDASKSERAELIQELASKDQVSIEQQLDTLDELLPPGAKNGLFKEFMRSGNPEMLFDPLVVEHLGLTQVEVSNMRAKNDEARKFLESSRRRFGFTSKPLPPDADKEFRRLRERIWAELPAQKLVKCFRIMGMIGENDELEEILTYFPDRSEYLISEVPTIKDSLEQKRESP